MNRGLPLLLLALTAAPAPHKVVRQTPALDFRYEWPGEAAAIPALDLRLYAEAKKDLADAQGNARDDQALARQQKRDFNQHFFSMQWSTAGETQRLLSLSNELGSFTGGAHPNSNHGSLIWDRKLNRETTVGALFSSAGQFPGLTRAAYCKTLDVERAKRRNGEKLGGDFDQCPKYSELAIYPADKNKNGRFDWIVFAASPYVAGPYVEGDYEVTLAVTPTLIAALKPEYRTSFEAQRQ